MNDRFKFRLWDKSISEMSYDVCVGFIKDGGSRDWVCADTTCGQINYRDNKLKDIVLMQCTGLKDKNGKLIYEGDIVEIWKFSTGELSKRIIVWNEARCGFRLYTIDHYKRNIHQCPQSMVNVTTIEVIGNIFQNGDLLNETKK